MLYFLHQSRYQKYLKNVITKHIHKINMNKETDTNNNENTIEEQKDNTTDSVSCSSSSSFSSSCSSQRKSTITTHNVQIDPDFTCRDKNDFCFLITEPKAKDKHTGFYMSRSIINESECSFFQGIILCDQESAILSDFSPLVYKFCFQYIQGVL